MDSAAAHEHMLQHNISFTETLIDKYTKPMHSNARVIPKHS